MYPYRSKDTPLHHPLVSNGSDFLTTSAPVDRIAKYCTIQQCRFLQTEGALFLFSETAVRLLFFSVHTTASPHPPVWTKQKKQHNKYLAGKRTPKQYEFIY